MNNKLVCPFCQTELEDAGIHSSELYFWCTNCYMKQKEKDDNYTASPRIWQALIQAKQDLEIARKALKDIAELALAHDDIAIADEVVGVFDMTDDKDIADEIRKQIEHKD